MRRRIGHTVLRIGGARHVTGLDDLMAELNTVSTTSQPTSARGTPRAPLRKVVRTRKPTGEPQPTLGGTEMLDKSLRAMKELESKLSDVEKKKKDLVAKIATDQASEKEGVAFPSAKLPMSSQQVRLDGGDQEFKPAPKEEIGIDAPCQGTVAHASVIGRVVKAPAVLEDSNGRFVEFDVVYSIPFETPVDVSITLRGYGDIFLHYCRSSVQVGSVVHGSGWLMPLPEGRQGIVCLPMGGNITVVK